MANPIIGIVGKHLAPRALTTQNDTIAYIERINIHQRSNMLRDEIISALFQQNATPTGICYPFGHGLIANSHASDTTPADQIVENQPNFPLVIAQIERCNGLIFQGGQYVDPYEIALAKYAYDHDIPTLGICSGQYTVAAILGKAHCTIVDSDAKVHHKPDSDYAHSIRLVPGTRFHDLVGQAELEVNSRHHTAIRFCDFLTASAHDDEGNIEVLEAADKNFYLGVRFHPESLVFSDSTMSKIFTALIDACNP